MRIWHSSGPKVLHLHTARTGRLSNLMVRGWTFFPALARTNAVPTQSGFALQNVQRDLPQSLPQPFPCDTATLVNASVTATANHIHEGNEWKQPNGDSTASTLRNSSILRFQKSPPIAHCSVVSLKRNGTDEPSPSALQIGMPPSETKSLRKPESGRRYY